MEHDVPVGHLIEAGSGTTLIVSAGVVIGFVVSVHVLEKIRAYRVPQSEIDARARESIATFGDRASDQLIELANRARQRGETEEETIHIRVARAVLVLQASKTGEVTSVRLKRRKTTE